MSQPFIPIAAALLATAIAAPALGAAPSPAGGLRPIAAQAPKPGAGKLPTRADVQRQADATFAKSDANNDRALSKDEIEAAQARAQAVAAQNIQNRIGQEFAKLDTDRSGQLSLAEFRAAAPTVRPQPGASAQIIQRLDGNKDGKISLEEYRGPMLATFDRVDANHDGTISADERAKAPVKR